MDDGQIDPTKMTYRVVGICPNNTRLVIDDGLSRVRAEEVRILLLDAGAFRAVDIEAESP